MIEGHRLVEARWIWQFDQSAPPLSIRMALGSVRQVFAPYILRQSQDERVCRYIR